MLFPSLTSVANDMKRFSALWFEAPRWARGLFLGNLCYLMVVGIGFDLVKQDLGLLFPFLWPTMGSPIQPGAFLYHSVWCALGALFVQVFGEVKGITILISLIYGVGIAILAYVLTQFSLPIF